MRINSIEGLILPNKKDEEFLKINFDPYSLMILKNIRVMK